MFTEKGRGDEEAVGKGWGGGGEGWGGQMVEVRRNYRDSKK